MEMIQLTVMERTYIDTLQLEHLNCPVWGMLQRLRANQYHVFGMLWDLKPLEFIRGKDQNSEMDKYK